MEDEGLGVVGRKDEIGRGDGVLGSHREVQVEVGSGSDISRSRRVEVNERRDAFMLIGIDSGRRVKSRGHGGEGVRRR